MQSPLHMTALLLAYVFFSVYVGPRLMANRKPFRLNTAMIIYNLCMVLMNAYIVYEVRTNESSWLKKNLQNNLQTKWVMKAADASFYI